MNTLILPRQVALPTSEILYLESESNYTHIHTLQKKHHLLVAMSLCKIQDALNQEQFVRLNRGNIINIGHVSGFRVQDKSIVVTLRNGEALITSRRRTEAVLKCLNNTL